MPLEIDSMLASLGAGITAADPKHIPGGKPAITHEDILALAAAAKPVEFHLLMAKYVGDENARGWVEKWLLKVSIGEWFNNPAYRTVKLEAGQLRKLVDLVVAGWLNPMVPEVATMRTRAAVIGVHRETWSNRWESHYTFLLGELRKHENNGLDSVATARWIDRRDGRAL